jgi:LmbE family N-acetylglucosaminyl deacetylase
MLNLAFAKPRDSVLRILCVGAHADDIEIGCGGTILRMIEDYPDAEIYWVVLGAVGIRKEEAMRSAERFLDGARRKEIVTREFRDGYFPYVGAEIKDFFETLKRFSPDLVLTHYRQDRHQDHRLVSDLSWNTFRDALVLEYEIPKWDGDLGSPNAYQPLAERHLQKKIDILLAEFASQRNRAWFEADTFRSLARLRGMEVVAPERYAEAFYARKLAFGIGGTANDTG